MTGEDALRTTLCDLLFGCVLDIHEYNRTPFRLNNCFISYVVPAPQRSSTFVVVVRRFGNLHFEHFSLNKLQTLLLPPEHTVLLQLIYLIRSFVVSS